MIGAVRATPWQHYSEVVLRHVHALKSSFPLMWQENNNPYGASSPHNPYYSQSPPSVAANTPLQFYSAGSDQNQFYPGSRSSLEGNVGAQGISHQGVQPGYGGSIAQPAGGWWTAFGTGGFEGEPPLLEGLFSPVHFTTYSCFVAELGINFSHIRAKSLTVLNPLQRIDEHIMDDADLAGPLLFFFWFATFLLFVSSIASLFSLTLYLPVFSCNFHIYSLIYLPRITVWKASVWLHLWCWSTRFGFHIYASQPHVRERYRRIPGSVCPGILFAAHGRGRCLKCNGHTQVWLLTSCPLPCLTLLLSSSGTIGYLLSILSIIWCTYAASGIFVAVLRMSDQRLLVAYPIGLLYGCFALLSVFNVGSGGP
jgi:hypothetical protein